MRSEPLYLKKTSFYVMGYSADPWGALHTGRHKIVTLKTYTVIPLTHEPSSFELSKLLTRIPSKSGMSEIQLALHFLLPFTSFSSTISQVLFLLQSVTLLACSLNASPYMPAIVLYYCTFQGAILETKHIFFIFLCLFVLCIICVKSTINLLQYSTI